MKLSIQAALLAGILALASCGNESLATRTVGMMSKMLTTLEAIEDKDDAEAATDDLKSISAKLEAIQEETSKLSKEEILAMNTAMVEAGLPDLLQKLSAEEARLSDIPGVNEVIDPILAE